MAEEIAAYVSGCKKGIEATTEEARVQLARDLKEEGTSGSAVIPNPSVSTEWRLEREELLAGFAAMRDELLDRSP